MKCLKCENNLLPDWNFCPICGSTKSSIQPGSEKIEVWPSVLESSASGWQPPVSGGASPPYQHPDQGEPVLENAIKSLIEAENADPAKLKTALQTALAVMESALQRVQEKEELLQKLVREKALEADLERELGRKNLSAGNTNDPGKHFFT